MSTITRGSIVWAALRGPNGELIVDDSGSPKLRPAVIISRTASIEAGGPIAVAAISTKFDINNLPTHWFKMPSQPGGHPVTGLSQPCVIKADWLHRILREDIDLSRGITRCPSGIFRQVINWAEQHDTWPEM